MYSFVVRVVALRVNSYPQVITDTLLALQTSQTVEKYTLNWWVTVHKKVSFVNIS